MGHLILMWLHSLCPKRRSRGWVVQAIWPFSDGDESNKRRGRRAEKLYQAYGASKQMETTVGENQIAQFRCSSTDSSFQPALKLTQNTVAGPQLVHNSTVPGTHFHKLLSPPTIGRPMADTQTRRLFVFSLLGS